MHISKSNAPSIKPIAYKTMSTDADAITLDAARETVRIEWTDGSSSLISARQLRAACRCAWCIKQNRAGNGAVPEDDLRFTSIELYGPEILHPVFTDGHRTGLFPFIYLRSLAHNAGEISS